MFQAGLIQNVDLIVSRRVMDQAADGGADALGLAVFCNVPMLTARRLMSERSCDVAPLAQSLSMADYLSMLKLLLGRGRQTFNLEGSDGLSRSDRDCYADLQAITASPGA